MVEWFVAVGAYLMLFGGLAVAAILRRPVQPVDPRAYETHNPEVSDWIRDLHER